MREQGWIKEATDQLASTIDEYEKYNKDVYFPKKLAWASNKRRTMFSTSCHERIQKFYNDTRFLLRIGRELEV